MRRQAGLALSRAEGRRLAVTGQLLAGGTRAGDVVEVVQRLGAVQRDPTAAVAPTEALVLRSRLARFSGAELDRLLYRDQALVDYWVHIVSAADLALHRSTMRRYPKGELTRARYVRWWLRENVTFRRYVLSELRRRGPLRSRDLEDRAEVPWRSGGWNDGKSLGRMLDVLWFSGQIAIVARRGRERVWNLSRRHPAYGQPSLPSPDVARRLVAQQLRALGVAERHELGLGFDGPSRGASAALGALIDEGVAVVVEVEGMNGVRYAHRDGLNEPWRPRTTLLSPFDNLIADRKRAEALFDFRFRAELYTPAHKRRHGYFVMPVLHGDRLIARIDPRHDRARRTLRIHGIHAESGAPQDAGPAISREITRLATWLGAQHVEIQTPAPDAWARTLSPTARLDSLASTTYQT